MYVNVFSVDDKYLKFCHFSLCVNLFITITLKFAFVIL